MYSPNIHVVYKLITSIFYLKVLKLFKCLLIVVIFLSIYYISGNKFIVYDSNVMYYELRTHHVRYVSLIR